MPHITLDYAPRLAQFVDIPQLCDLLRRTGWDNVALPARHAVTDLDTPEDWEAWRRGGG